jgi:superfamily II DNA or RNA helicase
MAETPADLGHDASEYVLPPLRVHRHKAAGDTRAPAGLLFAQDVSATTMHKTKRDTAEARADAVASLVPREGACLIWCDTDYEADALRARIPEAIEVRGSMPADKKEDALAAFSTGKARVLITKPSVAGFGMNWQHCRVMIFAGRSFSYEAWYQAVRRCYRFGQTQPVDCHLIVAEGEAQIGRVIDRKSADHSKMKRAMAAAMKREGREDQTRIPYQPNHKGRLPSWLSAA